MAPGIERLGSWICCAYLGRGLGSMNRKYSVQQVQPAAQPTEMVTCGCWQATEVLP
jgi:hypothetical protein